MRRLISCAAILIALISTACAPAPGLAAPSGPIPPPFSRRVTSAFAGSPFVTCDVGHHNVAADGSSARQRWYIRPVRVVTSGNHHFTLDKTTGTDRGIYFDACPPPGPR